MDERLIKYFIEETNKRFDKLDEKVDQLLEFKWQIIGGALIGSIAVTAAFNLAAFFILK